MLRIKAEFALGVVSLAVFTSVNVPGKTAPVPPAGYTFEMVTKATSSSTIAGPASGMRATGIVGPDGAMRMDITALEGTSMSAVGDYYIIKNGESLLVRPGTKTYVDIGNPVVAAEVTFSRVTAAVEKVAGTDVIDGHATEHSRTTVSYTQGIRGQSIPTTVVTDYWIAKLSVPMINPMAAVKNATTAGPIAELVNKQLEVAPAAASGVALKAVITTTRSAMGQSIVSTVTAEMKNLKEGNVDVSKIVMPEGYTKATR
ncbi:MAG: hypothetical protein ABI120_02355 [Gemmatimonadaceae bacterium]